MPGRPRNGARPRLTVLRIGHRPGRDPRLTTHVALTARAFGAERMYLHPPDPSLAHRIASVARRWGGGFQVLPADDWRRLVRDHRGHVVHLTMYGEPLDRAVSRLRGLGSVLVVVGGAKVPPALFELADFNVAVGAQPHSEVAALAVFADRVFGPAPIARFRHARRRIVPQPHGKRVIALDAAESPS
jgi:tRNA (cytidine56-2'-O)-methyltransferase